MSDVLLSIWRTFVPYLVSLLGVQAARLGVHLDDATVTAVLVTLGGTVYYAGARLLERRWPKLGWLLGAPKAPTYAAGKAPLPPIGPGLTVVPPHPPAAA